MTIEPVVWTMKEFKKKSTPRDIRKRHRGEELQLIDQTIEEFDKYRRTNLVATRVRLVRQIMECCKAWLVAKATKTSDNAQLRRAAVEALGKQCFEFLQYMAFEERKRQNPAGANNLRGMRAGYDKERSMYLAAGKSRMPVSGSYIHAVMDSRTGGQFSGRSFAQLTEADIRNLDTAYGGDVPMLDPMGDPGSMSRVKQPRTVLFLKKQERIKRLLVVRGNPALVWDGFDSTFETGITIRAYVIDEYGNLYSSNEIFDKAYSFNHSTFNAGKDVICAGTIKASAGELTRITNASGHYKPTRQDLHNAVSLLLASGLALSRLVVTVSEPDPARPGKLLEHDYNSVHTFHGNMHARASKIVPEP